MVRQVFLFLLLAAVIAISVQYGRTQCPPCRKLKCSVTPRDDVRLPAPAEIVVVKVPPNVRVPPNIRPQPVIDPAPVQEAIVAGPRRTYVSSNDTRWHEVGFVKGEGDRNVYRLFGHRKLARSERWEYFMRTKDGIDVPFTTPKDVELENGDSISVPGFDGQYKAVIYPVEQLVYNPNVV